MNAIEHTGKSTLNRAIKLAELGFYVFPIEWEDRRKPMCKWRRDSTRDPHELQQLWERGGAGKPKNIGIDCGKSGVVVFDEDELDALSLYAELNGQEIPETFTVKSGREAGGRHFYFQQPDDIKLGNVDDPLPDKIDVRGDGGLILAPGSQHTPAKDGNPAVFYEIEREGAIAPCPRWLVDILAPHQKAAKGQEARRVAPETSEPAQWRTGQIPAGKRDSSLFKAACWARGTGMPREDAEEVLEEVLSRCEPEATEHGEHAKYDMVYVRNKIEEVWQRYNAPEPLGEWSLQTTAQPRRKLKLWDYAFTDIGNAERLRDAGNDVLWYLADVEAWVAWDNSQNLWVIDNSAPVEIWKSIAKVMADDAESRIKIFEDDVNELINKLSDEKAIKKMAAQAKAAKEGPYNYLGHSFGSQNSGRIKAAINMASTMPEMRMLSTELNPAPNLLQCPNGVVDLDTGELLETKREMLHTQMTSTPYVKGKRSKLFTDFLNRMFGNDAEKIEWFRGILRAALFSGNLDRLFIILWGPTNSGKSTFVKLLKMALGEYHTTFGMSAFRGNFDEKPRPDLFRIVNNRLITSEEISNKEPLHADQIKRWVGGEGEAAVRTLFKGELVVNPKFTPMIAVNSVPKILGADPATLDRLRVVHTVDAKFGGKDVIPLQVPEVYEALLAWIVEGPKLNFTNRGDIPESAWKDQKDAEELIYGDLGAWIREECVTGPDVWGFPQDLYNAAKEWYDKREGEDYFGEKPEELKSMKRFAGRLEDLQFRKQDKWFAAKDEQYKSRSKPVYTGIGLKFQPRPLPVFSRKTK